MITKLKEEVKMRSKQSTLADRRQRSSQSWERGVGARKIGNPRYRPSTCMRNGKRVKVYRVR